MQRLYAMVLIFTGERDSQTERNNTFIYHSTAPDDVREACCLGSLEKCGRCTVWRASDSIKTRPFS